MDPMLMMLPPPRSRMDGRTACVRNSGARMLIAIMRSHSSGRSSEILRSNLIPAFVDQDVDSPKAVNRLPDDGGNYRSVGEVSLDAQNGGVALQFLIHCMPLHHGNPRSFSEEAFSDAAANPLSSARHQGSFAFERQCLSFFVYGRAAGAGS